MNIIIQKFGGTSVSDENTRDHAVNRIISAVEKGFKPVVVVSAIGREGDPYATDTLINFVKSIGGEPDPRELDILMSCGEIISAVTLSNTLKLRGFKVEVFTGGQAGIITDENYSKAKILEVDARNIIKALEKGNIPIIAGFQGMTRDGNVTTLGRGGSDVSAAIMGEALNVEAIEIYTDVDGIMTADPRIVSDASMIDSMPYDEVFQMAEYGSKVIHPKAVEIAMKSNIPLIIKNTLKDLDGTLITNDYKILRHRKDIAGRIITSVAQVDDRVQISVLTKEKDLNAEMLFKSMAKAGISIDMINIYPNKIYFIIEKDFLDRLDKLVKEMGYEYKFKDECSKVTIIGAKMRGVPGVMAKMVSALSKENIEILQSSDSHTTISCLIYTKYTEKAINAIHKYFKLGNGN